MASKLPAYQHHSRRFRQRPGRAPYNSYDRKSSSSSDYQSEDEVDDDGDIIPSESSNPGKDKHLFPYEDDIALMTEGNRDAAYAHDAGLHEARRKLDFNDARRIVNKPSGQVEVFSHPGSVQGIQPRGRRPPGEYDADLSKLSSKKKETESKNVESRLSEIKKKYKPREMPVEKSICERILGCLQSLGLVRRGGRVKRGGMSKSIRDFIQLHPQVEPFLRGDCPTTATQDVELDFLQLLYIELAKKKGGMKTKKYKRFSKRNNTKKRM
jgi:hypothetical protein